MNAYCRDFPREDAETLAFTADLTRQLTQTTDRNLAAFDRLCAIHDARMKKIADDWVASARGEAS